MLMKATEEDSSKSEVSGNSLLTWSYLVTENVALHNYSNKILTAATNELLVLS